MVQRSEKRKIIAVNSKSGSLDGSFAKTDWTQTGVVMNVEWKWHETGSSLLSLMS